MDNLKKYLKTSMEKIRMITTSIYIRDDQHRFIERHNLNLSAITRDAIDKIMSETESKRDVSGL